MHELGIMLSEISPTEKGKYCYAIAYTWNLKKIQLVNMTKKEADSQTEN